MCKGELLKFTEAFRHECENKTIFEAYRICRSNLECHTNWPKLMQLWQKTRLTPSSIAICERGFSKQDAIKYHMRNRLNLTTLDALMRISLCGLEMDAMDQATIFNVQRNMRDWKILTLSWFLLQIKIVFWLFTTLLFSKIFYDPKLRRHFRIKCIYICPLAFIFVFENVTWHFGFEIQRQIKFVKRTHGVVLLRKQRQLKSHPPDAPKFPWTVWQGRRQEGAK